MAMRQYFLIAPTLWTGRSGKGWRRLGRDYQVLGVYLQTSPAANQYGLYYVSRAQIAEETGIGLPTVRKILGSFSEEGYAHYDEETEWVWVVRMAAKQLLVNGQPMHPNDKRILGVQAWYDACPDNPYLAAWWDHYHDVMHLTRRRGNTPAQIPPAAAAPPLDDPAPPCEPPAALAVVQANIAAKESQDDLFERWWQHYPSHRKVGKRAARAEWAKIKPAPTPTTVARMIDLLHRQAASRDWIEQGGKYIPHPERYLKKGRFLDDTAEMPMLSDEEAGTLVSLTNWTPKQGDDE